MSEIITGRIPRHCYACYDFEPTGERTCIVCGLPVGKRLPEAERPPAPDPLWALRGVIGYDRGEGR